MGISFLRGAELGAGCEWRWKTVSNPELRQTGEAHAELPKEQKWWSEGIAVTDRDPAENPQYSLN